MVLVRTDTAIDIDHQERAPLAVYIVKDQTIQFRQEAPDEEDHHDPQDVPPVPPVPTVPTGPTGPTVHPEDHQRTLLMIPVMTIMAMMTIVMAIIVMLIIKSCPRRDPRVNPTQNQQDRLDHLRLLLDHLRLLLDHLDLQSQDHRAYLIQNH